MVWVAGNHDERPALRRTLLDLEPTEQPVTGVWDLDGLRLVALDSTVPGWHHGDLDAAQLAWLGEVLSTPAPLGTILALHHPPLPSHVPLFDILERSFHVGAERWQVFHRRIGLDNLRVVRDGARIVGGCGIYRFGQYWGGRCVPLWGIGAVGIAPELRGRGAARILMSEVLREIRAAGVPLSALHPASVALYRKVGYEQAALFSRLVVEVAALADAGSPELPVARIGPASAEGIEVDDAPFRSDRKPEGQCLGAWNCGSGV